MLKNWRGSWCEAVTISNIVKSFTGCGGTRLPLFEKGNQKIFCLIFFTALYFSCIFHSFFIITFRKNIKNHNIYKVTEKVLKPKSPPPPLLGLIIDLHLVSEQVKVTCSLIKKDFFRITVSSIWYQYKQTSMFRRWILRLLQNLHANVSRSTRRSMGYCWNGPYVLTMVINKVE